MNLVMERFGISRGEVMAFGDGINDIEMLSACDFSYAMTSSPEEVKIRAAFVTDNVIRSIKDFFSM
jgi:hydroxymethylpyrimidine pyrophosphatase-like HAD family hydrolase